jgi:3-methyladenine DNA glycosylase AlkD
MDMSEVDQILDQLKQLGSDQTKKVLGKHGAKEPFFGVKVADLTKIQKKIKVNHTLALQLFETGNSDAMYLAGMIADPQQMDEATLNHWADKSYWYLLSEYTVTRIAADSAFAEKISLEWIQSDQERIASAGWATLSMMLAKSHPIQLNTNLIKSLFQKIENQIGNATNRVKYTMNGFIIAAGSYVPELTNLATDLALRNGKIHVDMGGTSCKVPEAVTYIQKTLARRKK